MEQVDMLHVIGGHVCRMGLGLGEKCSGWCVGDLESC
jgi:hypothetical protein